jgi:hypothetical protein
MKKKSNLNIVASEAKRREKTNLLSILIKKN